MARDVHWELLQDPNVVEIAQQVAASAARKNEGIFEVDDLEQEALMLVAGTRNLQQIAWDQEYGLLHHALSQALFNLVIRPLLRSGAMDAMKYKSVPLEEERDGATESVVMFDAGSGDYTVDAVKLLLPAVWDESYCYGLPARENAPDADMPRGSTNKARGNNLAAFIADIKTGWAETPLTRKERIALLLVYGAGWTQEQVAHNQMCVQSLINKRLATGLKKIASRLNGGGWHTPEAAT